MNLHAASMMYTLETAADKSRRYATLIMTVMRVLLFSSVLITLLQSHFFQNKSPEDLTNDEKMYNKSFSRVNVIVPLLIGAVAQIFAQARPLPKYAAYLAASKRIESELWRFKMRVGKYRCLGNAESLQDRSEDGGLRVGPKNKDSHRVRFSKEIASIWNDCATSDASNGTFFGKGQSAVDIFDPDTDKLQKMIDKKFAKFGPPVQNTVAIKHGRNDVTIDLNIDETVNESTDDGSARTTRRNGSNNAAQDGEALGRHNDFSSGSRRRRIGRPVSEGAVDNKLTQCCRSIRKRVMCCCRKEKYHLAEKEHKRLEHGCDFTCEDYITYRVKPMMKEISADVYYTKRRLTIFQYIIVMLSGVSSGMAAFDQSMWIPLSLCLISIVEFVVYYMQLELKVPQLNATNNTLSKVFLEWDGLTAIQRHMPGARAALVRTVEDAILLQHEALVQAAGSLETQMGEDEEKAPGSPDRKAAHDGNGGTAGGGAM